MKKKFLFVFLFATIALVPFAALAQAPLFTLAPGQRVEYRFDYAGDGSLISIAFDSPGGASGVILSIYTPEQLEKIFRGESVNPIGRGTPQKNYWLYWSGAFNQGGTYRVVIENKSGGMYTYRLDITGEGVRGAAPIGGPTPAPTAFVALDGRVRVLNLPLPPGAGSSAIRLAVPDAPSVCAHVNQIVQPIRASTRLCANETYPPLRIAGSNIVLMGDESRTSTIAASGRQWAVTIDGSNNWVEGITVQGNADGLDRVAWLCQYETCEFKKSVTATTTIQGSTIYGGGILLNGSNSVVRGVTVRGTMIGIATVNGRRNYILENQLSDVHAWGAYNVKSMDSFFIANEWSRVNHACQSPDGVKFEHGCETSGWVCLGCAGNLIARNQCTGSGNCYYMSGERGLASNNNRFVANYCAAASDNCFEITFARDNTFLDNVATVDPNTGKGCRYPFWVGGSTVYFKNNRWECDLSPEQSLKDARASTTNPTLVLDLDAFVPPPTVSAPAFAANPIATSLPTQPTRAVSAPTQVATVSATATRARCVQPDLEKTLWPGKLELSVFPLC